MRCCSPAANIRALDSLFRIGFACYLLEAVCDIALSLILYVLLKPVRRDLALLAAFFGLMGTALFGAAELFYFAASHVLGGLHKDRDALTLSRVTPHNDRCYHRIKTLDSIRAWSTLN